MATIVKPNTFSAGATIIAAEHNENFDTIYNDHNGNISNVNVSASAAIVYSKLNISASVKATDIATGYAMVPTGAILPYGGSSAPSEFLLCNGAAVSRTTYSSLFTVISTTFGVGDGSTTFNLPDMKDVFPMGKGTTYSTLGGTGGAATKNLAHTHTMTLSGYTTSTDVPGFRPGILAAASSESNDYSALKVTGTVASGSGGSATQDVLNPYLTLNYIIKT